MRIALAGVSKILTNYLQYSPIGCNSPVQVLPSQDRCSRPPQKMTNEPLSGLKSVGSRRWVQDPWVQQHFSVLGFPGQRLLALELSESSLQTLYRDMIFDPSLRPGLISCSRQLVHDLQVQNDSV
jgi:hypothetical protein